MPSIKDNLKKIVKAANKERGVDEAAIERIRRNNEAAKQAAKTPGK